MLAQAMLCGRGVLVDGRFGPITKRAVQSFQASHGLQGDGIVGPKTWKTMLKSFNA